MKTNPARPRVPVNTSPRRKRTWRFYAVITFGLVMLLVGGVALALSAYHRSLLATYTTREPGPLTRVEVTRADRQALEHKWTQFYRDLTARRPTAPLRMSPHELNVFIAMMPRLRDRVYLSLEENRIRAEFSMPLDEALNVGRTGRFVNGVALLEMHLGEDGYPALEIVSLEVNGKPPPGWVQSQLDRQHLIDNVLRALDDPKLLACLESIEIRDGFLVFSPVYVR